MDILDIEPFGEDELLARLKRTRLKGHGQVEIYRGAALELARGVDPESLAPAQRYVLAPDIRRTLAVRQALLARGHDTFALEGGLWLTTAQHPDERIPVIPPVVEESLEPDGRTVLIVNDGMHRIYAARSIGARLNVVVARGVPREYPYYAYALPGGWSEVESLEALPEVYQKKTYRDPGGYKALFRDFNAQFPGVQKDRSNSNPGHVKA